jgi:hypothetical protein
VAQVWGWWVDHHVERCSHRTHVLSLLRRRRRAAAFAAWASNTTAAGTLRRKLALFQRKHCAQQAFAAWREYLRTAEVEKRVEAMHDDTRYEDNEIKKVCEFISRTRL